MKFAVVILLATLVASTAAFRLFPFGTGAGDSNLGATDDGSAIRTIFSFRFYGTSYTTARVSHTVAMEFLHAMSTFSHAGS